MWRSSAAKAVSNGKAGKVEADMARKLNDTTNSLSEGADRLERVVLSVKARQLAETHNAPVLKSSSDAFSFSPDEIWSKNYMTVGIGPSLRSPPTQLGDANAFRLPQQPKGAAKLQPPLAHAPSLTLKPVAIGEALSKPQHKRSWLGRVLRGG